MKSSPLIKQFNFSIKLQFVFVLTLYLLFEKIVSSERSIQPIEAGTLIVPIPIPQEYIVTLQSPVSKLANAKVIAGMTKFYFSQQTMFQFTYQLIASQRKIIFRFQKSLQNAISQLSIDYLVAKNIDIQTFNMTSYQWHMMHESPGQNQFADVMLLYLNGFSQLKITGNVTYLYINDAMMYTVHYMDGTQSIGRDSAEWNNQFILFTAVFTQNKTIQDACPNCIVRQLFHIINQQISLEQEGVNKFFGLKGYGGNQFKGQFVYTTQSGNLNNINSANDVYFTFDKMISKYNSSKQASIASVFLQGDFIDKRAHRIVQKLAPQSRIFASIDNGTVLVIVLLTLGFIAIIGIVLFLFVCKKLKGSHLLKNQSDIISEQSVNVQKNGQTSELCQMSGPTEQSEQRQIQRQRKFNENKVIQDKQVIDQDSPQLPKRNKLIVDLKDKKDIGQQKIQQKDVNILISQKNQE